MNKLRLARVKLPSTNTTLPLPIYRTEEDDDDDVVEPTREEMCKICPLASIHEKAQEFLQEEMEFLLESTEATKKAIRELWDISPSSPANSAGIQCPITPHTKRKRTRKTRVKKKVSVAPGRRVTRSKRGMTSDCVSTLNGVNGEASEIENVLSDVEPPKKRTSKKSVKVKIAEETKQNKKEKSLEPPIPEEEALRSPATPEPTSSIPPAEQPELPGSSSENEEMESGKPIEVRQLISLHETLIEKQQSVQSERKPSKDIISNDVHASPSLAPSEKNLKSKKSATPPKSSNKKRSIEEQVNSCLKKQPTVCMMKLDLASNTPQASPLVLRLESSSDEEDIAETVPYPVLNHHNLEVNSNAVLHQTPVGMAPTMAKRSLSQQLRLSLNESEFENSMNLPEKETEKMETDEMPQTRVSEITVQQMEFEDSLNAVEREFVSNKSQDTTDQTVSQASSSVCSSTAATVVLDDEDHSMDSQASATSTEEEEPPSPKKTPMQLRRSKRLSTKRLSTHKRPSVQTGVAAIRRSMGDKLRAKRIASGKRMLQKSILLENNDENTDSESNSDAPKGTPKIVKPVKVKRLKPPNKIANTSAIKRNLDAVESHGLLSPVQPKTKHMKCASPLCQSGSKTATRQRSRATFLNRSTAASRARKTPGKASPSVSRTHAALMGSPYKFNTPSACRTPFTSNLVADVPSFFRRNTPQKVNYEEELAAKKQQLEEKQQREKELKKKREAEKLRKIEEKRRKRSMKLRKAAELREKKKREEREKQQQMTEQWEKRVADAEKIKILRKKDETEKMKKLQKKRADAEEHRRRDEEEKIKKILEQEQEKEQRLQELKHQKEQEAAQRKLAEQQKLKEKQRQEKIREEKLLKKQEEERLKIEEEEKKEEKARWKMAEETAKLRQLKMEQEEAARRRKLQEEEERKKEEATKLEQARIRKEQQRLEEEARRKEKEEKRLAAKKKLEEEKALKRKQEEIAKAEELRRKREEIRKEAERRREEEKLHREAEKKKMEEEKKRLKQAAENEKLRKIQEANEKLRKLEEEHKREKERLKALNNTHNDSVFRTPGPSTLNSTYTSNPNTTYNVNDSPQSYEITPQVIKTYVKSTEENYNIDDLASDDSTDDDEAPKKTIPKWAKGSSLRTELIKQYYQPPDIRIVFQDALSTNEVMLHEIFKMQKARYHKRTSSAHWTSPIMPPGHISFTDQCRGFEYP